MTSPSETASPQASLPLAVVLTLAISAAACLLALFQWMELLVVSVGGSTVCGINDTVNCEAVWSSPLAERIHRFLHVPVAGLGLIWGLVAFALSLLLAYRLLAGAPIRTPVVALRLTAGVGVLACITFAVASYRIGALCLTCLGTYAVTVAFALVVFRLLPGALEPAGKELRPAVAWSAGLALLAYLSVLGPGLRMAPPGGASSFPVQQGALSSDVDQALDQYLSGLPKEEQLDVSGSLALFKESASPDVSGFAIRERKGPEAAPLRIVEFTDTLCSHCAELVRTMSELERALPPGRISVEPRQFPLANECNSLMVNRPDPSGVRCAGARAQICLEGTPDFWRLRAQLFEEQRTLTAERVVEIASSGAMGKDALVACMKSDATQQKLSEDIAYAAKYKPRGTPLVILNGKEGTPSGPFLYAMALTGGNAASSAFARLPPLPADPAP